MFREAIIWEGVNQKHHQNPPFLRLFINGCFDATKYRFRLKFNISALKQVTFRLSYQYKQRINLTEFTAWSEVLL